MSNNYVTVGLPNILNSSVFNALSIGDGLVTASVRMCLHWGSNLKSNISKQIEKAV